MNQFNPNHQAPSKQKHDAPTSKKTRYAVVIGLVLIFVGLFAWYKYTPGKYDQLAMCLAEKNVKFYGAFWCPHCQANKKAFGKSEKYLPYVECSEAYPDATGNYGQLQVCKDAGIKSYPTWEFADGTKVAQKFTPEELAEKVGCEI